MERTDFYQKTTVNDTIEYDLLYNNVSKFKITYPVTYYRVGTTDLMRIDLISYKLFGTEEYWWIIAMINGIQDIFHDMEVGQVLQIPSILDIYNFYKSYNLKI